MFTLYSLYKDVFPKSHKHIFLCFLSVYLSFCYLWFFLILSRIWINGRSIYFYYFHVNIKLSWQYLLNCFLTSLKYSLKVKVLVAQSCQTLCIPMDCSQAPLSMGWNALYPLAKSDTYRFVSWLCVLVNLISLSISAQYHSD